MVKILIVSHDVVDERMAGPGIRYWELARVLAREFQVTLAAPEHTSLTDKDLEVVAYPLGQMEVLAGAARRADVVLAYGYAVRQLSFLTDIATPWIADVYVPELTETLAWQANVPLSQREKNYQGILHALEPLARRADFFICASERQRDFWLGLLAAYGRVNPRAFSKDPSLRCLVDVVPFGLPSTPPRHRQAVLKGIWPGIQADDRVILWGGGLWDWLDPLTLLKAVAHVVKLQPKTRLVFPGTRHPNVQQIPDMAMRRQVETLAAELNLEAHVFMGDWLPYTERENYLLEADIGVSLHSDTVETRFAFRTRILDYIWAGLPMVVTSGDSLSEFVSRYGLGEVVPPNDPHAVAAALLQLLDTQNLRESYREQFEQVRAEFTWEQASEPIIRFCRAPSLTPDRQTTTEPADVDILFSPASELEAEVVRLRALVAAYEDGRFMRFMRQVHSWREKVGI